MVTMKLSGITTVQPDTNRKIIANVDGRLFGKGPDLAEEFGHVRRWVSLFREYLRVYI